MDASTEDVSESLKAEFADSTDSEESFTDDYDSDEEVREAVSVYPWGEGAQSGFILIFLYFLCSHFLCVRVLLCCVVSYGKPSFATS